MKSIFAPFVVLSTCGCQLAVLAGTDDLSSNIALCANPSAAESDDQKHLIELWASALKMNQKLKAPEQATLRKQLLTELTAAYQSYKSYSPPAAPDLDNPRWLIGDSAEQTIRQLRVDYALRKKQGNPNANRAMALRFRETLLSIAGPDAVNNLDREMGFELHQGAEP